MKIRKGFVSNSSSSSFIIGSREPLTKEKIASLLGGNPDSPFHTIFDGIVNAIWENLRQITSYDEFKKEYGYDDDEDEKDIKKIKKLFDKGFVVYEGLFSDDGEPEEALLCNTTLKFDGEDFYIDKDGGY